MAPEVAAAPTAHPTWFGPADTQLFGWWHLPQSGRARGAVVLIAPLGREQSITSSTYRLLADRLAECGFVVLRPDLLGVGDSAGDEDAPDVFAGWRRSVRVAVAEARRRTPGHVSLVGMRGGGLLAALQAEEDPELDALVLWDSASRGSHFLREQRALMAMAYDAPAQEPGVVRGLGLTLRGDEAEEFSGIDLGDRRGPLADHVLVLSRTDRPVDRRLLARMDGVPGVEWEATSGQEDLLVLDGFQVRVPTGACSWLADWFDRLDVDADVEIAPPAAVEPVVAQGPAGPVTERAVRIGDFGLFGVLASPPDAGNGPAVVLIGNELHTGPLRLWVTLGRRLAEHGVQTLRLDVSGLGESGVRPGQQPGLSFAPEAIGDLELAARWLRPEDPSDVVLLGLCSGAYAAVEAALLLGSRGVGLVNLISGFMPPEQIGGGVDDRRRAAQPPLAIVKRIGKKPWARRLAWRLPQGAWWAADRLRVFRSPAAPLELLANRGVDTLLLCGDDDAARFLPFAARHLERLQSGGRVRFTVLSALDHPLLSPAPASQVADLLVEHVLRLRGARAPTVSPTVSR